jgi:hypothetical protein
VTQYLPCSPRDLSSQSLSLASPCDLSFPSHTVPIQEPSTPSPLPSRELCYVLFCFCLSCHLQILHLRLNSLPRLLSGYHQVVASLLPYPSLIRSSDPKAPGEFPRCQPHSGDTGSRRNTATFTSLVSERVHTGPSAGRLRSKIR